MAMPDPTAVAVNWIKRGRVFRSRRATRAPARLLKTRLSELHSDEAAPSAALTQAFVDELRNAPLALLPDKANEQHYEVPAEFIGEVLGRHQKDSGCHWPDGVAKLAQAEAAALRATCERAGLADGHSRCWNSAAAGAR